MYSHLRAQMPLVHRVLPLVLAGAVNCFATKCVDGIVANRERCRELLMLNPSIATGLLCVRGLGCVCFFGTKT